MKDKLDMVDRYLNAVGFLLPKAHKEDVLRELAEDIRAQIEDKEAGLGRVLSGDELADLLKKRGSPITVAGRYMPQQYLIGPALFPALVLVFKILVFWVAIPALALIIISTFAATSPFQMVVAKIGGVAWSVFWGLMTSAVITFAIIERFQTRINVQGYWDPRTLPAVSSRRKWEPISRTWSIIEIIFGMWILLWWLNAVSFPSPFPSIAMLTEGKIDVTLGPIWQQYYWLIFAMLALGVVMAVFKAVRPDWSPFNLSLKVISIVFTLVLISYLMQADFWVQMNSNALPLEKLKKVELWANYNILAVMAIIGICATFDLVVTLRRLFSNRKPGGEKGQASQMLA